MSKLFIVGINGNMGRRYKAVANYLGIPVRGYDVGDEFSFDDRTPAPGELIIICTPTSQHLSDILYFQKNFPNKILCEKPIVTHESGLVVLSKIINDRISMVNNYVYTDYDPFDNGPTFYDYFHSGPLGLEWDCIQLITIANGTIDLRNKSPIWKCAINGSLIKRAAIDRSYVKMIRDHMSEQVDIWKGDDIINAHLSVFNYIKNKENYDPNTYWNTGSNNK